MCECVGLKWGWGVGGGGGGRGEGGRGEANDRNIVVVSR